MDYEIKCKHGVQMDSKIFRNNRSSGTPGMSYRLLRSKKVELTKRTALKIKMAE